MDLSDLRMVALQFAISTWTCKIDLLNEKKDGDKKKEVHKQHLRISFTTMIARRRMTTLRWFSNLDKDKVQ